MPPPGSVAAILLAAGGSSRLGQPKQLVTLGGVPLARRAALAALDAGAFPLVVVLGASAERVAPCFNGLPVALCTHAGWQQGMGSSLAFALRCLVAAHDGVTRLLLLVCDQYRVDAPLLRRLLACEVERVACCHYAGRLGVPAVFPRRYFPELLALNGDQGARRLLAAHGAEAEVIDFPAGALDVDTPGDLAAL